MRQIAAWITSIALLVAPLPVYGDEADDISEQAKLVTTLEKGEIAPYSGTLFSTAAAASLLAQIELTEESCQLEVDRRVNLVRAEYQLEIDNLSAKTLRLETNYNEMLAIKNGQIDFLDTRLEKASKPKNELWFALGVVGGIVITGAAAWSLNQAANP